MEKFKEAAPDVAMTSPINSGIHVYTNWTPLLEQRASYHQATCAYHHPANKDCRRITANDCPKTLEYLARTVYFGADIKCDNAYLERVAETAFKVANTMQKAAAV